MAIDSNIWSKQFRFEGYFLEYSEGKIIWSPADFVRLLTDKEMISL